MIMVIGNKSIFGIEFEITDEISGYKTAYLKSFDGDSNRFVVKKIEHFATDIYGYILIYINGHRIGRWDEKELLGTVSLTLSHMSNVDNLYKPQVVLNKKLLYEVLDRDEEYPELGLRYAFQMPSFDDYNSVYFINNDHICFIWRFNPRDSFNYGMNTVMKTYVADISIDYFRKVVNEFANYIK